MFYLFFIWLFFIESIIDWEKIVGKRPKNRLRVLAFIVCAIAPTIYVLAANFLGSVSQAILKIGQDFGIQPGFLSFDWPLSLEYVAFVMFFVVAIVLAYGKEGLKSFSISHSLLGGMTAVYMIDTVFPFGAFKLIQLFALPTAASTAALFDFLGYKTRLTYPVGYTNFPRLWVGADNKSAIADVGWPCAGVHSLLLYVLIILVFFKRSKISSFRKLVYFIVGFVGTYFVNILRIYSILIVMLYYGQEAGIVFHNSYGELYFFTWMFLYILLIVFIQRFMLVERTRYTLHKLRSFLATAWNVSVSYLKRKLKKAREKLKA